MADAPPKKKLPFKQRKKPSAPVPTPSGQDAKDGDELELFSRARDMRPILEADRRRRIEKERRKAESQAKLQAQGLQSQERRRSSEKRPLEEDGEEEFYDAKERLSFGGAVEDEIIALDGEVVVKGESFDSPTTPSASKRARTQSGSASSHHHATPSRGREEGSPLARRGSRLRSTISTPSKRSSISRPVGPSAEQAMVSLDSDDEDVKPAMKDLRQRPVSIEIVDEPDLEDDVDEDDEFAEYIRKAEEEKKRLTALSGDSSVQVLLTSEIEGTTPVQLKVKLDQSLIKVKEPWIQKQFYTNNVRLPCPAADLVISWNRDKVYNYSNLYALGIRAQGDLLATDYGKKGLTSDRKQVHLEISTPEIYQRWEAGRKAEQERQRRQEEAKDLSEDEVAQVIEDQPVKLRVILRARNLEDLKLTVRKETCTRTLIAAYRRSRSINDGETVTVWFDGEQMEDQSTLEELEIEDMDKIEVHIN